MLTASAFWNYRPLRPGRPASAGAEVWAIVREPSTSASDPAAHDDIVVWPDRKNYESCRRDSCSTSTTASQICHSALTPRNSASTESVPESAAARPEAVRVRRTMQPEVDAAGARSRDSIAQT